MLKWWNRWLTAEKRERQSAPLIEELEPRVLLSADAVGAIAPDSLQQQAPTELLLDDNLEPAPTQSTAQLESRTLELVFVDTDTPDYATLVDALTGQASPHRQFEVILLDNQRDGIWQISQALQNYSDISAIHLVSHGADGLVELGDTQLDSDSLRVQQDQLLGWSNYLTVDADILIYGCNLAAGEAGLELMRDLSRLTGADIAASEDLTGHASLGGNWVLEARVGQVETQVFASQGILESFRATLAAPDAVDDNLGSAYDDQIDSLDPESYFRLNDPANISDNATPPNAGATANGSVSQESGGALSGDSDDSLGFDPTDGDDDYIQIPHSSAYEIDNGTISLWFKTSTISGESLFSKDASGTAEGGHLSIYFTGSGATAQLEVRLQNNTGAGTDSHFVTSTGLSNLNDDQWHNVVFTFGTGGMQLYVDGALQDTDAYTGGMRGDGDDTPNQEPIALGASRRASGTGDTPPSGDYFNGSVDELAIIDSQLTPEQIEQLYRTATGPYIVDEEGTLNVDAAAGVLANDDDGGEATTASLVSGPANAAAFNLNADGSFSYTPDPNFSGTDTFVYQASNVDGSDTATATITVNAAADSPAFWDYSHSVGLSAATPSANYPVQLTLTEGVDGFSHANAQANGEDLRFYDGNGNALDYWIEDWNSGGSSTVWVEVADAGTSAIELYYGNAAATAQSSGSNTFAFFDDFSDGSVGSLPAGWTLAPDALDGTPPSIFNDGGNFVFHDGANGANGDAVYHGGSWSDLIVVQDFRVPSNGDPIEDATLITRFQDPQNALAAGIHDNTTAKFWYTTTADGWTEIASVDISAYSVDDGNWHTQEVRVFGNTMELYIDGNFVDSVDVSPYGAPASGAAGFWSQEDDSEAYRDNHRVMDYDTGAGIITATAGAVSSSVSFDVDDDRPDTTPVGSVRATDPDGDTLTYSITAGNTGAWAGGAFAIDGNGLITVNNSAALDAQTTPSFTLTIEVDDGTGRSDTETVNITVNDATPPAAPVVTGITDDTAAADNITSDNQLLFSGTAEASSTVEVFLDGASIGTTTADGAGDWSFDHTGTTLGDGSYTLTAEATDGAGNTSVTSAGLAFTVDTAASAAPVVSAITDDTGAADNITSDNQLVFSGTAEANSSVEVFIDGASIGTTTADGAGDWSFDHTGTTLADGGYTITAEASDTAGNTSATSGGLAFTVDTVGPSAAVSGISIDTAAADNITADNQLVFSGTAEANNPVEVFLDGASLGTTTADGAGDWSFDHTGTTLGDGSYTLTARATDPATGQAGAISAGLAFTVDTVAPAAPTVTGITDDTAAADNITSDNRLVFSGTAEAGSSVEVFLDGASLGTTAADGAGNWSFDHSGTTLADGSYTLTAEATDTAGNSSVTSAGFAFTVDATAPSTPAVTAITDDTAAADSVTSDNQLVFSGTADANIDVEVFLDGASLGTTTADSAGNWTFDHTGTTLADGSYSLTAEAFDTAGNTSATSAGFGFTVDATAPSAPAVTAITDDTGAADNITSDNQLLFSGTAEANSNVEVFLEGASLGTTPADGAGNWSFDHTGTTLADGSYTLTAEATDTAGNTSATSAGLAFTVATSGPGATVSGYASDTGAADDVTADNQLVFSGSATANSSVEVFLNGVGIGTTLADGVGNWSFDHTGTALADGSYDLTAQATNTSTGLTGLVSNTLSFEVDTTGPSASVTSISQDTGLADNITADNRLVFRGMAEAGNSVELFLSDGGGSSSIGSTIANGAGNWSFDHTGTTLADGTYTLLAVATDPATGQAGALSGGFVFTVDTSNAAPTGTVTISEADPIQGSPLTVSNTLSDADGLSGPISYQWLRDGVAIAGGQGTTYTPTQDDVGASLSVIASYTDDRGTGESVSSAATNPVANLDEPGTGGVSIDNLAPVEGDVLTVTSSLDDPDGLSGTVAFQWQQDGVDVTGQNGTIYVTTAADVGAVISVVASYIDDFGGEGSAASVATAPVASLNSGPVGSVTITGEAVEDETLTVSSAISDPDGVGELSYQWQRDGEDVPGATGASYLLGQADVGTRISVVASYVDGGSTAESLDSDPTAAVDNRNDAPQGSLISSDAAPEPGTVLSASGVIEDEDGISSEIRYQWMRDGEPIPGAVDESYLIEDIDSGSVITVQASYVDGFGTEEIFLSGGIPVSSGSGGSGTGSSGDPGAVPGSETDGGSTQGSGGINLPNDDPAGGGGTVVESPAESPAPFTPLPTESGSGFESRSGGTPILELGDDLDLGQRAGTGASVISVGGGDDGTGSDPSESEVILAEAELQDELVDSLLDLIQGDDAEEELGLGAGSASALAEEVEELLEEESDAIAAVLTNHAMWDAIDRMHDQMEQSNQSQLTREELVVQLVSTSSVGIFAALTMYALRGGALMASWLSTVPIWGTLDPLPILRTKKDEQEPEEAEPNRDSDPERLFGSQGAES